VFRQRDEADLDDLADAGGPLVLQRCGSVRGRAVIPLILPSGRQVGYRGALRTIDLAGARRDTMNFLPLESYLGVGPSQVTDRRRPAARRLEWLGVGIIRTVQYCGGQ
jgi:hypothetical protein